MVAIFPERTLSSPSRGGIRIASHQPLPCCWRERKDAGRAEGKEVLLDE
jgi:hypothetical protein